MQELLVSPENKLSHEVLSGGLTNYAYRVFVDIHSETASPSPSLFVKLALPYALWSTSKCNYPTSRLQNELDALQTFANIVSEGIVIVPLGCFDLSEERKVLVTPFSTHYSEQYANQFINFGATSSLDPIPLYQVARALATFNSRAPLDSEHRWMFLRAPEQICGQEHEENTYIQSLLGPLLVSLLSLNDLLGDLNFLFGDFIQV